MLERKVFIMKVPQSAKKMIPRTCSVCGKVLKSKEYLVYHIDKAHKSMIPTDWSAARYENYLRTGKTHGNCLICNENTDWNESTWKYKRICDKKSCNDEIAKKAKANMVKKYGKEHLLNDPDMQRKMVYAKHTSGLYEWDDEEYKKTYIPYASQMEYKFLEMLNGFLNLDPTDVIGPSPNTYQYKYKGEIHQYIPDYYIPSLNLEIEIKEPKDNQNQHPKIQAVDKVKENLKDKVMESNKKVHYIKVNGTDYSEFLELFMYLKMDNTVPKNETKTVTESVSVIENLMDKLVPHESIVTESSNTMNLSSFKLNSNPSKEFVKDHLTDADCVKEFLNDSVRRNSCMFLDTKNNKIACVFMVFNDRGHHILNNFEVTPDYRGNGLSKQLLDYAVKKKGADHLWVNDDNHIAMNLYKKYGFKPTGDSQKDGNHTRLYMALESVVTEVQQSDVISNPQIKRTWGQYCDGIYNSYVMIEGYNKPLRGRSEILVVKDNKVFLSLKNDSYKIPGGTWDENEDHMQSAVRECNEEALMNVKNTRYVGSYVELSEPKNWMKDKIPKDQWWYGYYIDVYIGEYSGKYIGHVNQHDKDSIGQIGKFYDISKYWDQLKDIHKEALTGIYNESVVTEGSKVLEKKNGYDLAVLSARISQNTIDLYDKKFDDYKSVRKRITGMINDSTYTTAPLVRDHLTMVRNNLALILKQKKRSNEWYDAQKLLKDMDTLYLPKINKKIQILANSNNAYVTEGFDEANSYFVQESFITGELGNTVFRPVYIFLSFTFSPLAKIIKKVTSQEFSHSSIAFDSGLKDLCSFGTDPDTGRMGFCAFENIKAGLYKNPNAYYALYVYLAPEMEYIAIKDAVEKFKQRADKLRYSVAGLANILFGKETNYKNEWFCSEFVANVMSIGNPKLFEKHYSLYTPGDLAKIIQFTEVDSGKIIKYDEKKVNRKVKKLLAERGFTNVKTRKN